jgi:hypothetical protein
MPHEDQSHSLNPTRWLGRSVSFDYPAGDAAATRLVGTVEKAEWAGYTQRGHLPDFTLYIRGKSGALLKVSMVESYATFTD